MGKHLTYEKRLMIDRMLVKGHSIPDIAYALGCHQSTIYREVKRARYLHLKHDLTMEERYNPEAAHKQAEALKVGKGIVPKILQCDAYRKEIGRLIIEEHYSPEAALFAVNKNGVDYGVRITSVATVYKAIRNGFVEGVSMKDCPLHGRKKVKKQKVDRSYKRPKGISIEERSEDVLNRLEFGHWEMDSVIGKRTSKACLLVLTERKTRYEIIEPLKDHGADEVITALRRIKRLAQAKLGSSTGILFKSITCDNGMEFSKVDEMSKIAPIYFAHPRSPFERGSNEVNNKLIRRFFPKFTKLDVPREDVKQVEKWMNNYPRRLFNGMASVELFDEELLKLQRLEVIDN